MTANNRRGFLKQGTLLAGTTLAAGSLGAPAIASGKRKLKMVMTWPKGLPGLGTSVANLIKMIETASEGRITIKLYGAGELVPAFECFEAVSNGTADLFHGVPNYWLGKNPAFTFFGTIPFGMIEPEFLAWIRWGGGQQLYDELYAEHNLKPFLAGNPGVQMGGWFRNEINSLEDLKGLKMRISGFGGKVYSKLGASSVTMPGGEIFGALQAGTVDAAEFIGPWSDLSMGFYKVAPYYYAPGFQEPASSGEVGINKKLWDSMTASEQMLIESCIGQEYTINTAEYYARNTEALNTLVNKHGVKVRDFSDDIYRAFAKESKAVMSDFVSQNSDAKRVYKSYSEFQKKVSQWTNLSTNTFVAKRTKFFD